MGEPMKLKAIIFAALCALATPASALTVTNDGGGVLAARANEIAALYQSGEAVRITGYCASACTMYLALSQTCVTPTARLGFHAPAKPGGAALPKAKADTWRAIMSVGYPSAIKAAYAREWGHHARMTEISGAEAIAMGVTECR